MIKSNLIVPGMIISIGKNIFRVESAVMVTVSRGVPFIKTKLKNLMSDELVEKNFKQDQEVEEVKLIERTIEYLYMEGKNHLFLDVEELDNVQIDQGMIEEKVQFLKEGVQLKAMFYGDQIFSIELPQFLELMVIKSEESQEGVMSSTNKVALLETGARVEVPLFIESGDIIKVDTQAKEYVQRV
ncbi:MAG: elongation factor P [Rhabdochlamydiaceae bacterium]|nr:elongation factor P [Candidatus Amphrikana amoebophyrae]